jgi:hypothetical protein
MVLWCRACNALLGLREPISNWSTDRTGLCQACLEKEMDTSHLHPLNDTSENKPLQNSSTPNSGVS